MATELNPALEAEYHNNASLEETPACEVTTVPLIIHPDSPAPSGYERPFDNHHPEHPRLHSQLSDEGGLAIRHSRVHSMNHWVHHNVVHLTFRGPKLPVTTEQKFYRAIFSSAGLIPQKAIYLHGPGEYSLVDLDEEARLYLWEKNLLRIERTGILQNYFQNYVISYAEQTVSKKEMNDVIAAQDPEERWLASKGILKAAVADLTQPIAQTFESLYDRHLLPPTPDGNHRPKGYGHRRVAGFLMSNLVTNRDGAKSSVSRLMQERFTLLRDGRAESTAA